MKKTLLFNATAMEKRAALLEDGKLAEIVVERDDHHRILGNIYRARITTILPGIQSAFVDIGIGKSAFLHASDVNPSLLLEKDDERIERYTNRSEQSKRRQIPSVPIEQVLEVGQDILVQVSKEPIGNKSPKLTTQISIAGRFLVLVPDADFIGVSKKTTDIKTRKMLKRIISQIKPKGVGFIVRTIGLKVSETELVSEMKILIENWRTVQKQALISTGPRLIYKECGITTRVIRDVFSEDIAEVYVDNQEDFEEIVSYLKTLSPELRKKVILYKDHTPLFDHFNIEKEVDRSIKRKVWLKNGGYLYFDHTEALLAIDINTGRNVGKKDLEDTIFQTNLVAAQEICRQLRLRDIGGLIVVDFIDMRRPDHRRRIEAEMRKLLAKDSTALSYTGLSKFGLMEITRKRVRPELQELFTDLCHSCNGLGRVFSPATVTSRIDRWLKRAVVDGIRGKIQLTIPPSIADYLRQDNNKIMNDLKNVHPIHLELVIDETLDQDEFDFYLPGSQKPITEKYS